jgi:anti-sigma regulatory factor (Ser/Thr protein kinase)
MAYRWLTLAWSVAVFTGEVLRRNVGDDGAPVAHPVVGAALLGGVAALNTGLTLLYRRNPDRLLEPAPVLVELFLMAGLLLADVWVYGTPDHAQALPSVSVVAGIVAAAMGAGLRPAIVAGFGLGLARYVGWLPYADDDGGLLSVGRLASWVLLVVAGWTAGYILRRLEAADRSIATYRAREEVARTLHDGVLQTLAVIQRRSDDAELVDLARTQERELREYLFGASTAETDLASALRATARRAEERHALRVEVICAPDLPRGTERQTNAVCGAVGEALTNAAKHGRAERVTVYAEPDADGGRGPVFVSVKDDGSGFDAATVREGHGMGRSIRGRIAEVGGRVEVDGRPGRGAEIRIWA